MRDVTLGQFIPGDSPLHRMDPRTKICIMLVYIVMTFLAETIAAFAIPLAFLVFALLLSGIRVSYIWKSIKPIRLLLVFMFVLNLLFSDSEGESFQFLFWTWDNVIFDWGFWQLTFSAIYQSVFITIRIVLLVAGSSMLTLTTSPLLLTDGIERLLSPLKVFRFPAHELAMMMTIAIRFIPTLMEESDKIQKAQMARGADFESGNLFRRIKSMVPILIPLFVSAFRKADELAIAMESRCYHGGEGRTRMRQLRFSRYDLFGALITLVTLGALIVVKVVF